jgi:predicted transcriptional regulator
MTITQQYLTEFKKLEAGLRRIAHAGDNIEFREVLVRAKKLNPFIVSKENLIWDLYGLRNVIAHSDREKYIAEINQLAFDSIAKLIKLIEKPPLAGDVFKKEVYVADMNSETEDVIKEMRTKLYTHVPIYRDKDFIGILSEATIFNWLVDNIKEGMANFRKLKLSDINPKYLNNPNEQCKFIRENVSIFYVLKMFEEAIDKKKRLGAVFITRSGTKNEKPVGVITAWDLPKIKEFLK